jgi:hypothetical protein
MEKTKRADEASNDNKEEGWLLHIDTPQQRQPFNHQSSQSYNNNHHHQQYHLNQ